MKLFSIVFAICLFALSVNAQPKRVGDMYNTNLIKNPGAEQEGQGGIPGWNPDPKVEQWYSFADTYGHVSGEWDWDCKNCGLPANAGKRYFRLPTDDEQKHLGMYQDISLSSIADTLAKRKINFVLNGYVTGFLCDETGCGVGALSVTFYDKDNKELKTYAINEDNAVFNRYANADDHRMMQFMPMKTENEVPQGAVRARVKIESTAKCCNGSYLFFDNLGFMLSKGEMRK